MKLAICLAVLAACAAADSGRHLGLGQYGTYWSDKFQHGRRHLDRNQIDDYISASERDQDRRRLRVGDYRSERGQDRHRHQLDDDRQDRHRHRLDDYRQDRRHHRFDDRQDRHPHRLDDRQDRRHLRLDDRQDRHRHRLDDRQDRHRHRLDDRQDRRHRLDDYRSERDQDRDRHPSLRRRRPTQLTDSTSSEDNSDRLRATNDSGERHGVGGDDSGERGVQTGRRQLGLSQNGRFHSRFPSGRRHPSLRRRRPTELTDSTSSEENPDRLRPAWDSGERTDVGGDDYGKRTDVGGDDSGKRHNIGGDDSGERTDVGDDDSGERARAGGDDSGERTGIGRANDSDEQRVRNARRRLGLSQDGTHWPGRAKSERHHPDLRRRHPTELTHNTNSEENFDRPRAVGDSNERHGVGREDDSHERRVHTGRRHLGRDQVGTFRLEGYHTGRRHPYPRWRHPTELTDSSSSEENSNRLWAADDSGDRHDSSGEEDHDDSRERHLSHLSSGRRRVLLKTLPAPREAFPAPREALPAPWVQRRSFRYRRAVGGTVPPPLV